MQILVDADACPKVIKEILFRAAERRKIHLTLVANKMLYCPPSSFIRAMQVAAGFDVADNRIAQLVEPGDLVITADIPLAADVIARGGHVLNPRGEFYTRDTIRSGWPCAIFMDALRGSGVESLAVVRRDISHSDRRDFANQLDKFLAKQR